MNTASKQRNVHQTLLSPPQGVSLVRVSCILSAFVLFHSHALFSISLVCFAELLDMLDGYLARKYNAVSAFGAISDMVIDRLTPIYGFTALISLAPNYTAIFSLLLALDLLGHMAMLYCAILKKEVRHHKHLFIGVSWLLDLYYSKEGLKRSFMVSTIVFYDLAILSWLLYLIQPALIPYPVLISLTVLASIKVYIHLQHLYYSFKLAL